jgi:hypothetical protein
MADASPSHEFVERLGLIVGVALVLNMSFMTVAPYVFTISPVAQRLIDQQQTILQSIFMVLVGYLWGNSAGNKTKDDTIGTLATTAKSAQEALAPVKEPDVILKEGESVTVTGEEK